MQHLGTYVENKSALDAVRDAVESAMRDAYANVPGIANAGLDVGQRVRRGYVPLSVLPPYGVIMEVTDMREDAITDMGTIGKRVTATVQHRAFKEADAEAMGRETNDRLTGQAVAVSGFSVLDIRPAIPDVQRWEKAPQEMIDNQRVPLPENILYYVDQQFEFMLRPSG